MFSKTIVVVSSMVDATIREYQPDVEFKIFKTLEELGNYLDKNPIRAQTLFFTSDVVGGLNSTFTYLRRLVVDNDYMSVDNVIYLTNEDAPELESFHYLVDEYDLDNWEVITGNMSRAFISEVINGTFRDDKMDVKRKAVYRRPRQDYVKQQLRNKDSLEESYVDDDANLGGIPDEEMPVQEPTRHIEHLEYVYIAGHDSLERTAFAFLSAQYIALNSKVIIIESDPDYHRLTEFATKSEVEATVVAVTQIYEDPVNAMELIRNAEHNLVIIECIDRLSFDYKYMCQLVYYNLVHDFQYMICEISLDEITEEISPTVVIPSTVIGVLQIGEYVDKSLVDKCNFVGVNLQELPETHINSGVVMSTLLSDVLSTNDLVCPVITVSSLRLKGSVYDFGEVLGWR